MEGFVLFVLLASTTLSGKVNANTCPDDPVCPHDEMLCPGPPMEGTECPPPATCMRSEVDGCPSHCPVICGPDQKRCDGQIMVKGTCPTRDVCVMSDQECPQPRCPKNPPCDANMLSCPAQNIDTASCADPPTCLPLEDINGCPSHCPVWHCDDPCEKLCPGNHENGACPSPNVCVSVEEPCPEPKLVCPQLLSCPSDMLTCRNPSEPCELPPTCLPKEVDGCPSHCPVRCGPNQRQCQGIRVKHGGCSTGDVCVMADQECPYVTCPADVPCDENLQKCYDTQTPIGASCGYRSACIPLKDGGNCTQYCPAHCTSCEKVCSGPVSANGCPTAPETCVMSYDECPTY